MWVCPLESKAPVNNKAKCRSLYNWCDMFHDSIMLKPVTLNTRLGQKIERIEKVKKKVDIMTPNSHEDISVSKPLIYYLVFDSFWKRKNIKIVIGYGIYSCIYTCYPK